VRGEVLALLVEASFGGEVGDGVVVGYVYFVLLSNNCVQVRREDVAQACSHHYHVVFVEVVGRGLSLFAEP
jgi:hypothetical protein